MIIAKLIPIAENTWRVSFEGPAGTDFAPVIVHKVQDAHRLLYFNTRNYIHDKLSRWLVQRSVALAKYKEHHKLAIQQGLYDVLKKYQNTSYSTLCATVHELSDKIILIAPPEHSKQRKYYEQAIFPILEFCRPKKLNG
nr:hypothetical protein [uncultured Pedobacter sp.]